jgi:hypothetical protein
MAVEPGALRHGARSGGRRTVTENARTLRFDTHEFESE